MSSRIPLAKKWREYLMRQPESGMGYHRVDVFFEDGTTAEDCVVFNSEEIELPDKYIGKDIMKIKLYRKKTSVQQ
jgi:hypothetical protein